MREAADITYNERQILGRNLKIYGQTTTNIIGTQKHTSIFVNDNHSVTLIDSLMKTGQRHDNGKKWHRWEDQLKIGFYKTSTGKIQAFQKNVKYWDKPTKTWNSLSFEHDNYFYGIDPKVLTIFRETAAAELKISKLSDVYPISNLYSIKTYSTIPPNLITEMRACDIMEFTSRAFGKSNYRKDLVRAVAASDPYLVSLASCFRGLVPADWIIKFLNESKDPFNKIIACDLRGLREVLLRIDPRSYRRMLNRPFENDQERLLEDVCETYRKDKKRKVKNNDDDLRLFRNRDMISPHSFTELHDLLLNNRSRYYNDVSEEITQTKLASKIDGKIRKGLRIYTAKHTDEMLNWSNIMNNCIGMYATSAVSGRSVYGCVFNSHDKMIANFEIREKELVQLLGPRNSVLLDSVRIPVESLISDAGIKVEHYWGDLGINIRAIENNVEPGVFREIFGPPNDALELMIAGL